MENLVNQDSDAKVIMNRFSKEPSSISAKFSTGTLMKAMKVVVMQEDDSEKRDQSQLIAFFAIFEISKTR